MSIPWDASMNVNVRQARFPSVSRPGGEPPVLGLRMDPPTEAINAVDVALARQELLAAANASTPLGRAIILRLAASITGRAADNGMPAIRIPVLDRFRG